MLLDTHILLWWLIDERRLTKAHRGLLEKAEADGALRLATISLWEIALLVARGRVMLPGPAAAFLEDLERDPRLSWCPLTAQIAADAAGLGPEFPRDPADRIIAATARCEGLTLVTADQAIRDSGAVAVI